MARMSLAAGAVLLVASVVSAVSAVSAASAVPASQAFWVHVEVDGEPRASFFPRASQTADDLTAVGVPVPSDRIYRTEDGRAIAGLRLTGWFDDGGAKVIVSLQIIKPERADESGDPAHAMPPAGLLMDPDRKASLEERLHGVYDIGLGETVEVPDADSLGFESLTLKAREGPVPPRPHPG